MQELRFVAVSEDGTYAVLAVPGRSGRFTLPIDDRLRAVARGQFSRLAQYEIEMENPLRPKEIQARIRAGETVEEIADAAGIPAERVRWFEGPVLAERAYVAQQAQAVPVRRQGDSAPGPRLGDIVADRLAGLGADPEEAQWDSRKLGDGSWQIQLACTAGGRLHIAEWVFDPRRRHVSPADDNAARLSLLENEGSAPAGGSLGQGTVTPLRPRPERQAVPQRRPLTEPAATGFGADAPPAPPAPAPVPEPGSAPPAATAPDPGPLPAARPAAGHGQGSFSGHAEESADGPEPADSPEPADGPEPADSPEPGKNGEQAQPARPSRRAGQRGRRSSVPSWDEIMLGNSRQQE